MIKLRTAISSILDVNNLYRWEMSQKPPSNNFDWIEYTSQFTEDFLKNCNEESDEEYSLHVDVQYIQKLHDLRNDLPIFPVKTNIEKVGKLVANLHGKT